MRISSIKITKKTDSIKLDNTFIKLIDKATQSYSINYKSPNFLLAVLFKAKSISYCKIEKQIHHILS